jgi:site-specific DNA-methyltransferase (adenine-specific)
MSNIELFRYVWYWEKEKGTGFLNAKSAPLRVVEEICVFSLAAQFTYNPQMSLLDKPYRHTMPMIKSAVAGGFQTEAQNPEQRQYQTYTHGHPKNLLRFSRDKALMPTQKPLALLDYLVRTYTHAGQTVLDNTMGSGTCGVACQRLKRDFIGMEADTEHFNIARQRIETDAGGDNNDVSIKPTKPWSNSGT